MQELYYEKYIAVFYKLTFSNVFTSPTILIFQDNIEDASGNIYAPINRPIGL